MRRLQAMLMLVSTTLASPLFVGCLEDLGGADDQGADESSDEAGLRRRCRGRRCDAGSGDTSDGGDGAAPDAGSVTSDASTPPPSSDGGATTPPPAEPAFLTRPMRAPVDISNATDVELSNFSVRGGTIGIHLRRVKRAFIHHVDLADLVGGIYIEECEDVRVEDVRGRNIGDGTIGSGHSNYIQFATSRGGAVRRNRFLGGRTEDMISIWHSGGWGAGSELVVEDNHLEGRIVDSADVNAWTSRSGTGVILSDGAGHAYNGWIIVRRNTFLDVGQVAIQHIDGRGLQTYDNVIYGEPYSLNNNPITSWEGTPQGEVHHNRYRFIKADGSEPSPWFHSGSQLDVHDNLRDTTLSATALKVSL